MEYDKLLPDRRASSIYVNFLIFLLSCQMIITLVNGESYDLCHSKEDCSSCIRLANCSWCSKPDFGDVRCLLSTSDLLKNCTGKFYYNPKNSLKEVLAKEFTVTRHRSSKSDDFESDEEIVQIKPQKVKVELRSNEKQKIKFYYRQTKDYPLDLYFLMDLSNSMKESKEMLSKLGDKMALAMRNLTSDFRIGFGSFIDKVVMPYVNTVKVKLEHPCDDCAAPYGFKNVMPLSNDIKRFKDDVKHAPVSGNLDAPEGGFDAIMQAIVCEEEIGWREQARKLLVFSTDELFHYAGDGKLGGIVKPNDGLCHLDEKTQQYNYSDKQDYPSVSQITAIIIAPTYNTPRFKFQYLSSIDNEQTMFETRLLRKSISYMVKQKKVNLIFAVTHKQVPSYKRLSGMIDGSYTGELTKDSENVVVLVRDQYQKITSGIEIKDNASKYLKVSYYTKCLNESGPLYQVHSCRGLKVGDQVEFEAHIELKECPKNRKDWNETFRISPVALSDALEVSVSMLCDCPCEHSDDKELNEENSNKCNKAGTFSCGLCKCHESNYGRNCECDNHSLGTYNNSVNCYHHSSPLECSGRGQCVCGQCVCDPITNTAEKYYGQYCECNNFQCDSVQGKLCNGPDHGVCECDKCKCKPGWKGDRCDCDTNTDKCIRPQDSSLEVPEICTGRGDCVCNKCICKTANNDTGDPYTGRFCESCKTCRKRCDELKDCVECRAYKRDGQLRDGCAEKQCYWFTVNIVKEVSENPDDIEKNVCYATDQNDCRFMFSYDYNFNGKLEVNVEKEPRCREAADYQGIAFGVILTIVLAGIILLLIWKAFTTVQDRREFAKFENERAKAKWDDGGNPIYKPSTSTFKNPIFDIQTSDTKS